MLRWSLAYLFVEDRLRQSSIINEKSLILPEQVQSTSYFSGANSSPPERERERERERETERDRDRDRDRDRQTDRQTETQRHRDRHRDRDMINFAQNIACSERETETDRDRQSETDRQR